MLTIDPVTLLMAKLVYDADGKKLGKVTGIVRAGANDFSAILVKKNIFSKPLQIPKQDIATRKTNILLNKLY